MRINRLFMQNFLPVYMSLGKTEIEINLYGCTKVINLIVGKMGSCKTFILGHLQPFHTFGTLDVRNQDDMVIQNKNGLKIIEYEKDGIKYVIRHDYIWNKNTHNVKSYIQKDGKELNENGNQSSFKLIVENEFGIEQNFLRLLRLGPNVTNLINMKSSDRKMFVASLQKNTELYLMLYKNLLNKLRDIKAQTKVLSDKLYSLNFNDENKLRELFEANEESIKDLRSEIDQYTAELYGIDGSINQILSGSFHDKSEYIKSYYDLQSQLDNEENIVGHLRILLDAADNLPSQDEISKEIGSVTATINFVVKSIADKKSEYRDRTSELEKLEEMTIISSNEDYIKKLEEKYSAMKQELDNIAESLKNFNIDTSANKLTVLLEDIKTVSILISEILVYDSNMIKKLFYSDSSVLSYAQKQLEILYHTRIKLQKEMNNIKFSVGYQIPSILYRPPLCPTKTCPYYVTHPFNLLQGKKDEEDAISGISFITNQLDEIEIKISKYRDYPFLYKKIMMLKDLWKKITPQLSKINALIYPNLINVLLNLQYRNWYNYDRIIYTIEMCKNRDEYYDRLEQLKAIKTELDLIKLNEDHSSKAKIASLKELIKNLIINIGDLESDYTAYDCKLNELNRMAITLANKQKNENDLNQHLNAEKSIREKLASMEKNIELIQDAESKSKVIRISIKELEAKLSPLLEKNDKIKVVLSDIEYTKKAFEDILKNKRILEYILDATSAKEGIPLIMVKIFLAECKDSINDLISDIFDDEVEIMDFNISDTEFKIPYMVNGYPIEDVEKASQGQQSIISIALSFALLRQCMFEYNIMLLDEVDGPLYEHDRQLFIAILDKQLSALGAEQVFLITHNNTFTTVPTNIIMTTDELIQESPLVSIMKI